MSDDKKEYGLEWWMEEISSCEKNLDDKWRTFADVVVDRYLDNRSDTEVERDKFNIFWSNVQIMKASLYAIPPRPMVSRQNADANDDIARVSANVLERMLHNDLTKDRSELHACFRECVEDKLVAGLGQVWFRYEPTVKEVTSPPVVAPDGTELVKSFSYKKIVNERAIPDYVHWKDFLWSSARIWEEVWWVARRVYMRPEKFIKRFGKEKYNEVKKEEEFSQSATEDKLPKKFKKNKVETFEVWCRATKKAYFLTRKVFLEEKDDPYKLEEFFPCPKPLLATHTTNEFLPRCDYRMVQDQYEALDDLTARINLLESALRVAGVYDKTNSELKQLLGEGLENVMIPVADWGNLSEKKGLSGSVDWLPIEQVAKVVSELREQKREKIQEIYELTGMSDIMRGATSPRETAAAQKIKAQYSSVRVQFAQQEVALFVQHALRIKAEIIVNLFQPETIIQQSNIEHTPDVKFVQPALQLLKDSNISRYRIEVNEESLALPDYNQERDMRVEYLTTVGQFVSQVQPLIEKNPSATSYVVEMIKWVTSGFRGSKEIETVLDAALDSLAQKAQEPQPPPPPDPEEIRQREETARVKMKLEQDSVEKEKDRKQELEITRIKTLADMILADKTEDLSLMKEKFSLMSDHLSKQLELKEKEKDRQHEIELENVRQLHEQAVAQAEGEKEVKIDEVERAFSSMFDSIAKLAEAQYTTQQQLGEIQTTLKKRRVRIPQRDENGDIIRVVDQLEDQ